MEEYIATVAECSSSVNIASSVVLCNYSNIHLYKYTCFSEKLMQ